MWLTEAITAVIWNLLRTHVLKSDMEQIPPQPPSQSEIRDFAAYDGDVDTQIQVSLLDLSAEQRQQYYKEEFRRYVEPLEYLSHPDLCNTFPELAYEILEAYLRWVTFSVPVWVNYDAAAKMFYIDRRTEDCGKLRLREGTKTFLRTHYDRPLEFGRVRLEVGTPFHHLCNVDFRTVPSTLNLGHEIRTRITGGCNGEHPDLLQFIENVCANAAECKLEYGQKGLRLQDVQDFAQAFHRKPTEKDIMKIVNFDYDSVWMDQDRKLAPMRAATVAKRIRDASIPKSTGFSGTVRRIF